MGLKEENFFSREHPELRVNVNIGIKSAHRKSVVNVLSTLLASTQILSIKTFSFHWNMRGELSGYLRSVTKEQYDELVSAMNSMAERIRTLGYNVPDTYEHVMKLSDLDGESYNQIAILSELVRDNEKLAQFIRDQQNIIKNTEDHVSLELLLRRLEAHEKNAWIFRNILER